MKVSLLQRDILWEDKAGNLRRLLPELEKLSGRTDLVVLPEMFSTGFSMESEKLAEPADGTTMVTLGEWSRNFGFAIAGSYIAVEGDCHYNRGFFITPQGVHHYYDKRHLFRMGNEREHFCAGREKKIVRYLDWNICLMVCYDLRFPVWCRNVDNGYDLLLFVANWPTPRIAAWDTLLRARALENSCFVAGVNRIGTDGYGLNYPGQSALYNARGENLLATGESTEQVFTAELSLEELTTFRKKFPVWKDADRFILCEE